MRCPHCQAEPPQDPFVCAHCGEHLLTYLGEPLGPGTGLRADELGPGPEARRAAGLGAGAAGVARDTAAPANDDGRSWLERQLDPTPPTGQGPRAPGGRRGPRPAAPRPARGSGGAGSLIGKILFGLLVALLLLFLSEIASLLLVVGLALLLLRWPRLSFIPFATLTVALAGTLWVAIEVADAVDTADLGLVPGPTPTVQRSRGTPTVTGLAGTPTLAPFQATATATAIAGETRTLVARGRARWLRGDTQAAREALDRALTLSPRDGPALNLRALVRISAGDYAGAIADSTQAVSIQPSSGSYRDTYAYALLKSERYAEARDEYDRALMTLQGPGRTGAILGVGLAHLALGNLSDAATSIRAGLSQVADVDPDPQLADLEASARRALPDLPPVAAPVASPSPAGSPTPATSPSPAARVQVTGTPVGRAP